MNLSWIPLMQQTMVKSVNTLRINDLWISLLQGIYSVRNSTWTWGQFVFRSCSEHNSQNILNHLISYSRLILSYDSMTRFSRFIKYVLLLIFREQLQIIHPKLDLKQWFFEQLDKPTMGSWRKTSVIFMTIVRAHFVIVSWFSQK